MTHKQLNPKCSCGAQCSEVDRRKGPAGCLVVTYGCSGCGETFDTINGRFVAGLDPDALNAFLEG